MSYNRDIYTQVRKEFEGKYKRNIEEAELRREELHSKSDELCEIDEMLSSTGLDIFGEAIKGKDGLDRRIDKLKEKNQDLLRRRNEIVISLGYPADYSDIKYECNKCHDVGSVNGTLCECFKKAMNEESYKKSGIGKLIKNQSFDTFNKSYYNGEDYDNICIVYDLCKEFAYNFKNHNGDNMIFLGNTGLGKTHMTTSIAKVVIDGGDDVVYETAQNVFYMFENEHFKNSKEDLTSRFFDSDLLIIDDLGAEMNTSFTVSCLYNIINTRINNSRSVIISTNLDWNEIRARYTDRIFSRLLGEFTPVEFKGTDIRMQKLNQ